MADFMSFRLQLIRIILIPTTELFVRRGAVPRPIRNLPDVIPELRARVVPRSRLIGRDFQVVNCARGLASSRLFFSPHSSAHQRLGSQAGMSQLQVIAIGRALERFAKVSKFSFLGLN